MADMMQQNEYQHAYPNHFTLAPDPLYIAIPKVEIVAAMKARGEEDVIDDVCVAVAVIVDALEAARLGC